MVFEFSDTVKNINFTDIDCSVSTVAYVSASEFEQFYGNFGIKDSDYASIIPDNSNFRSKIEFSESYSYVSIKIIKPEIENQTDSCLLFFIKKNLVIIVDVFNNSDETANTFTEAVKRSSAEEFSIEKFIYSFIDSLIKNDNISIENLELQINRMEDTIFKTDRYKNFNEELLRYKRKLLQLSNYYKQLIDIGEAFIENENGLYDKAKLNYFIRLVQKAEGLCTDINLLRENVVQLRELYQSSLDMKLNNTMKLFTVITAIFSPLTLITGWYGMNFVNMPELRWKYGYLYVSLLALSIIIFCICIFKRKKLL